MEGGCGAILHVVWGFLWTRKAPVGSESTSFARKISFTLYVVRYMPFVILMQASSNSWKFNHGKRRFEMCTLSHLAWGPIAHMTWGLRGRMSQETPFSCHDFSRGRVEWAWCYFLGQKWEKEKDLRFPFLHNFVLHTLTVTVQYRFLFFSLRLRKTSISFSGAKRGILQAGGKRGWIQKSIIIIRLLSHSERRYISQPISITWWR